MQQFARRQPSDGPSEPAQVPIQAPLQASDETMGQLLDQLCDLRKAVTQLSEEVAHVKGENHSLRVQIAGWMANQEAIATAQPFVAPSEPKTEPVAEAPVVVAAQAVEPPVQPEEEEPHADIDEESLVEAARKNAVEEAKPVNGPLSDNEIQRLLAEAAGTAAPAEPVVATEPEMIAGPQPEQDPGTFLHIQEDEQPKPLLEYDPAAVARVPSHLAIAALALPVRLEANTIVLKAVAPFDQSSLDMIADAIACQVVAEEAPIEEVLAGLRKAYAGDDYDSEREAVWAAAPAAEKKKGLKGLFRRAA